MPSLSLEERKKLLVSLYICHKCNSNVYRSYCRECDEFFLECLCGATLGGNGLDNSVDHRDHRNYRWFENIGEDHE